MADVDYMNKLKDEKYDSADVCTCEFDQYDDSDEESWHYKRTCAYCGNEWYGLHCKHDGYQNPCPQCKKRPE